MHWSIYPSQCNNWTTAFTSRVVHFLFSLFFLNLRTIVDATKGRLFYLLFQRDSVCVLFMWYRIIVEMSCLSPSQYWVPYPTITVRFFFMYLYLFFLKVIDSLATCYFFLVSSIFCDNTRAIHIKKHPPHMKIKHKGTHWNWCLKPWISQGLEPLEMNFHLFINFRCVQITDCAQMEKYTPETDAYLFRRPENNGAPCHAFSYGFSTCTH